MTGWNTGSKSENKRLVCWIIIILLVGTIVGTLIAVISHSAVEEGHRSAKYEQACLLAISNDEADLITAYNIFCEFPDYKDSTQYLTRLETRITIGIHDWYQKGDVQWCADCGAIMDSNGDIILPTMMYRKDNR